MTNPHFTIIQCGRNLTAQETRRNLLASASQVYGNYTVAFVDDASTESHLQTPVLQAELEELGYERMPDAEVETPTTITSFWTFVHRVHKQRKVSLARNKFRAWGMHNIWLIANLSCTAHPEGTVLMFVGGDDRLAHDEVLDRFANVYGAGAWVVWAQARDLPSGVLHRGKPYPPKVIEERSFREATFDAMHPFTCRSELWKKVRQQDYMLNGRFVDSSSDLHFMLPILEMTPGDKLAFIDEVLYYYNTGPQNDASVNGWYQIYCAWNARIQERYSVLKSLDDEPTFDQSPSDSTFVFRSPRSGKALVELERGSR